MIIFSCGFLEGCFCGTSEKGPDLLRREIVSKYTGPSYERTWLNLVALAETHIRLRECLEHDLAARTQDTEHFTG